MTFFTEAKADGHINDKINMSEQELEMMILGMIEDSSAWSLHKNKHKDAHIAPIFKEDMSEFENQVNKHSKKESHTKFEEPQVVQYDAKKKMFKGACNCGAEFDIDIKNDKVEQSNDPSLKMKELNPYDKNRGKDEYERETSEDSDNYNSKPAKQAAINYNSNSRPRMTYKN